MGAKMKLLFEGWRKFEKEALKEYGDISQDIAGNPDSKADNSPQPAQIAKALERSTIERAIEKASFNSGHPESSDHRWGSGQPIIDYRFDNNSGVWTYAAYFPDGSKNVDNWPSFNSEGEGLEAFLKRVKEFPRQQELPLPEGPPHPHDDPSTSYGGMNPPSGEKY
jgi:hypothetical protein